MSGFLRRLTRRWWVLLLGVVIGLGAGLPLGGSVWPDDLRGAAGRYRAIDGY